MTSTPLQRAIIVICLAVLSASWIGCASTQTTKTKSAGSSAVFYPPPPDTPRLQFLTSFSDTNAWTKRKSTFADFVVGGTAENSNAIRNPYGLAMRDGKLYVCDLGRSRVHIIDMANKRVSVLGTPDQLTNPVNITLAADGSKYVCDTTRGVVAVYDSEDRFVRHLGAPQSAMPADLAIANGELFVANMKDANVLVWDTSGTTLRTIARKGDGPDELRMPTNLDIGPDGNIYVSDTELQVVKVFTPKGDLVRIIGRPGDRPGNFARPKGLVFDPDGHLYITDAQWEVIQTFNSEGQLLLFMGYKAEGPAALGMPAGIAVDATSVKHFQQYVDAGFEPQYLLLVANQFGVNKINVYAYGKAKGAP